MSLEKRQDELAELIDGMPSACRLRAMRELPNDVWVDPEQERRCLEAVQKVFGGRFESVSGEHTVKNS